MEDSATDDGRTNARSRQKGLVQWPPSWLPPLAILVVALVWPIMGYGAGRAWQNAKNRVEDWLPASFPETQSLHAFSDRFGSDEFLMISWQGCDLDDPRATEVQSALLNPAADGKIYFAKADSGRQVVDSMVAQQRITESEAKRRLAGVFVGADGKQSCVVALVSPSGTGDRKAAVNWAWTATTTVTGLSPEDIRVAGTTADSVAVDEASNAYLLELNAISLFLCFLILIVALRAFWLVVAVFLTALFNQHLALAFIYFTGGHIDSVQLLVANLCFVLTISAGLHYLGYFRKAVRSGSPSPALLALQHSLTPTILAAVTTSIGFVSLCISELVPIRSFGFYAAVLVPINAMVAVTILAIHATWASRRNWLFQPVVSESGPWRNDAQASEGGPVGTVWSTYLVPALSRRPIWLMLLWIPAIAVAGLGGTQLKSSVGTHNMLSPESKLIRDYSWLESKVGPLVPVELVLRFPALSRNEPAELFRRLAAIDQLRQRLESVEEIKSTLSVLTFLPPLPTQPGLQDTIRRVVIGKLAIKSRSQFADMRLLYEDDRQQSWRMSGRVKGSTTQNYEQVLSKLQVVIDDFRSDPVYSDMEIEVSGGIPFIFRTQRQLLADLLSSFSVAFLMIAITMAVLFRSLLAGLLLMIPNITPAALVFGSMGWLGMEVELGTVLTASVMMGICVDDTLHLMSHFRSLRQQGLAPVDAVHEALRSCGGAMLQTALVCGLGMLVFAFSPFTPVARFAWLTFTLLIVGAISDLVLTPTMLLSPLNSLFYRQPRPDIVVGNSRDISVKGDSL